MLKQGWKLVPEFSENWAKMWSKIDEKSSRFRNVWFFDFCDTSPVILRFFMFQGSQHRAQIHQKAMQNRCPKTWGKQIRKWSQKGSKMGAEIGAISEKDGKTRSTNRCKKLCEKRRRPLTIKKRSLIDPWCRGGRLWSRRGEGATGETRFDTVVI